MSVMLRAQARPLSQAASSTSSCLRKSSRAGGSRISQPTTRSTVWTPTQVDRCFPVGDYGVGTLEPADHRPALGIVAVRFEHGHHVGHGNRQLLSEHWQPCGLFGDGRRSSGLARQPYEELVTEAEQRV